MDKMRSLLNRSLMRFIVCTAVILLICTPLFYLLTRHFYAEDMIDLINSVRSGGDIPANDLEIDIITGLTIQFGLIIGVLSIALVVTMQWVSKRLWIPFEDTLRKTEKFNLEDTATPVFMETNTREFHELNVSLTKLMKRSVDSYRQQKEFTENASHELQTPIAIVQSKLDVLLQEDLTERQTEIVQELYDVGSRMARLNRNLLLLAKIENNQFMYRETVDFSALADNMKVQLQEIYGNRNNVLVAGDKCTVSANRPLAEIMVNNLLINAFRHTAAEDEIVVSCLEDRFVVANTAKNGALDSERIFSRFNHSSDSDRGTGIGLAIVKAICDYHGWRISYSLVDGKHTFTVELS